MKYVIVIPSINQENTDACVSTIDPEIRKHMLIVDNTQVNKGVARSWNIGIDTLYSTDSDYLIICSASMRFNDGMRDLISKLESSEYGVNTQHGWHLIALSRKTIDTVGRFDENFYPAYYEDTDYVRRMEIAGIHQPIDGVSKLSNLDVSATAVMNAYALRSGVKVNMLANTEYFLKKWGGLYNFISNERHSMFSHPFNNVNNNIDYCESVSLENQIESYIYG